MKLVEGERDDLEIQLKHLTIKYQDLEEENLKLAMSPKSRNKLEKKPSIEYKFIK